MFSQKHRATRDETFARSKNGSVLRRRVLYIFTAERTQNPLFHPQKANRRAPSSRARDDAKRIFRFERRDVNKNAFTHRATRKRERLHVVLNATTRRVSSSAVLFFFSLSLLSAAQSFFFSLVFFFPRARPTWTYSFFGRTLTLWLALLQTLVYKRRKKY